MGTSCRHKPSALGITERKAANRHKPESGHAGGGDVEHQPVESVLPEAAARQSSGPNPR
jgi:hypothetical protein